MIPRKLRPVLVMVATVFVLTSAASAGGPLLVGGPGYGISGQPFTWNASAMPIQYRVDSGPMSKTAGGTVVVDHTAGLNRVQGMFAQWQQAPNAAISFQYAGTIQPVGTFQGGDVVTVADFNAVEGSCEAGTQSPIIFDANGRLVSDLGLPPDVIGFASPCHRDTQLGYITSGFAVLNGAFQDGIDQPPNYELTSTQFDGAITHELGHFIGLDHSQINVSVLNSYGSCAADDLAGLPLMFPIAICQSRSTAGLPTLAPDDQAWVAKLYPGSTYATAYGTIRGVIFFSDGITPAQGVNVIARQVDDPATPQDESKRVAVSVVSGFLFTGNPGQSVTGDNQGGDPPGSRDPKLIGFYEIPVPPGTYTVEVESINYAFRGGSSVGPLNPPISMPGGTPEFWNSSESAFDDPRTKDPIAVGAGQTVDKINIILNGTPERFDRWEDNGALLLPLAPVPPVFTQKAVHA